MSDPTTRLVWITRDLVTPLHIEGLHQGLQQAGALSHAELRIIAVSINSAAVLPEGRWTMPDGRVVHSGATLTYDNLPPQGILIAGEPI